LRKQSQSCKRTAVTLSIFGVNEGHIFGGKPPVGETRTQCRLGRIESTDVLGCTRLCAVATSTRDAECLLVSYETLWVLSSRRGICVHNGRMCGTRMPTPGQLAVHTACRKTPEDAIMHFILNADLDVGSILRSRTHHAR
jgi:hypothetical protein